VQESRKKERVAIAAAAIAAAARAAMRVDELSRVDVILLLYMYLL
jgi:hypothetical protein